MNPARCWSDRPGNVFEKSNNVVIRSLFDLQDLRNGETRSLANFRRILLWDLAQLCHRLAGKHLNLQPNLELPLIRPDFAHFWPRITIDHSRNIKAACLSEKRFVDNAKHLRTARAIACVVVSAPALGATTVSPLTQSDSTPLREKRPARRLTNAGAQETPVVVQTHSAAGQKVRDCCDRLFVAAGAGAYRKDQITERKPGARF